VCADCPYWEARTAEHVAAPVTTIEALRAALENTYRTRATCQKIIEAFGPVQPFVTIRQDEERHARSLRAAFGRLGVNAPPDTWPGRVNSPSTLAEACAAASRAELERLAVYDRLIPSIGDPAVRRVLRRIREASSRRYLPAFRRCFVRALAPAGRPRGVRGGRSMK
jgi:rubrerythrin